MYILRSGAYFNTVFMFTFTNDFRDIVNILINEIKLMHSFKINKYIEICLNVTAETFRLFYIDNLFPRLRRSLFF